MTSSHPLPGKSVIFTTLICSGLTNSNLAQFPDYYGENYKASMAFYENQGQKMNALGVPESSILYSSEAGTPELDLKDRSSITVVWSEFDEVDGEPVLLSTSRIDMRPVGELAADVTPAHIDQAADHLNYYTEEYPGGLTGINGYQRIKYEAIYPGIDMEAYSGHAGAKLAFHCGVGGDPANITLNFAGQDSLHIDLDGALRIYLRQRWIALREAVAYQYDGNTIIPVNWNATYTHSTGSANVRMHFDTYNEDLPLVFLIGQVGLLGGGGNTAGLLWSSYYSGNGWDELHTVDHDDAGNIYAAGYTQSGLFPVTTGSSTNPGSRTAAVVAFNSSYQRLWATMYGGSNAEEIWGLVHSPANGKLYATGSTSSSDFPLVVASGAYNGTGGFQNSAPFIIRFETSTGVATWATRIGSGSVRGIGLAPDGSKYLVGQATSTGLTPVAQAGSYNQSYGGGDFDGTLYKFNSSDALVWSTWVGAQAQEDVLKSVCVDGSGNVYTIGTTNGAWPLFDPGGGAFYQSANGGGETKLTVMKFNSSGARVYSSFYGGTGTDDTWFHSSLAVNGGRLVIIGRTESTDFPVQTFSSAYNDASFGGTSDGFVLVMNTSNMSRLYASYIGGSGHDELRSVCFDTDGNAYVTGHAGTGFPITSAAALYNDDTYGQAFCTFQGYSGDGVIMRLDALTLTKSWATYFGGGGCDELQGCSTYSNNRLAVVGFSEGGTDRPFFDSGNEAWYQDGTAGSLQSTIAELNISIAPIGLNENERGVLTLLPNPAHDNLLVMLRNSRDVARSAFLLDPTGRVCLIGQELPGQVTFDTAGLAEGGYLIRAQLESGTIVSSRLIVSHE